MFALAPAGVGGDDVTNLRGDVKLAKIVKQTFNNLLFEFEQGVMVWGSESTPLTYSRFFRTLGGINFLVWTSISSLPTYQREAWLPFQFKAYEKLARRHTHSQTAGPISLRMSTPYKAPRIKLDASVSGGFMSAISDPQA